MATKFQVPDDTQWDETPRTATSTFLRNAGWLVAVVWLIATLGYALWQVANDAEQIFEVVLVFGLWLGFGLIFLSVLIDRLRTRKTDPSRKVQK